MNKEKENKKIVSFLQNKFKENIKSMYCSHRFYSRIRSVVEYFEEYGMDTIIEKGIYGKFLGVGIIPSTRIKDYVYLSEEKYHLQEDIFGGRRKKAIDRKGPAYSKEEEIEDRRYYRRLEKLHKERFFELLEKTEVIKFKEEEIIGIDIVVDNYKRHSDSPLVIRREGDEIVIRMGIERLDGNDYHPTIPKLPVEDWDQWIDDVIREMHHEREDGSNFVSDMFDHAMNRALDYGTESMEEGKPVHHVDDDD